MTTFSVLRNKHFIRHYIEMAVAMVAGMVVLGLPAEQGLHLIGSSSDELADTAPWAALLGMATIMTIPMVALMRWRGHSWRPVAEMSSSMYLPSLLAIGLVSTGAMDHMQAMMLEHVAMFPAMLVAMLLRPEEYIAHPGHGTRRHADAAAAPEPALRTAG